VTFHLAMGFRIDDGPGTARIYGITAHPNHDGEDEDRVVLFRDLEG
jgi:hypothetical protein